MSYVFNNSILEKSQDPASVNASVLIFNNINASHEQIDASINIPDAAP